MSSSVRPYWPPLTAGIALGLVLLATFLITGHGLGASGFFTRLTAWVGGELAPSVTETNSFLGPFLRSGAPLANWISWEIVGVAIGGLLAAIGGGRFHMRVDGARNLRSGGRIALALGGGTLTGFGVQLSRGCTSGLGLSGGATLAVAAFLFLIGFFIAGIVVSFSLRRAWI